MSDCEKSIIEKQIKNLEKLIKLAVQDNAKLNADISGVDFPVFMSISNLGAINAWETEMSILKNLLQEGGEI